MQPRSQIGLVVRAHDLDEAKGRADFVELGAGNADVWRGVNVGDAGLSLLVGLLGQDSL